MINSTFDLYYKTLGVSQDATIDEIKQAFRQKISEYHPQKNKKPNAREQFILLFEAYDCLIYLIDQDPAKQIVLFNYWIQSRKSLVREKAQKYALMPYETFEKTNNDVKNNATITILEHIYVLACILIILSPLWGYLIKQWMGFIVGLIFTAISGQFWIGFFAEKFTLSFRSFIQSLLIVFRTKTFFYTGITVVNLILIFRYTLNTQLTLWIWGTIMLTLYGITYIFISAKKIAQKKLNKTTVFIAILPTIFNLFFLCNFVFSSNPKVEKYSFIHEKSWYHTGRPRVPFFSSRARLEEIGYIDLENNKYKEYYWFRMFFDFDTMKDKQRITYTFEKGLFGLRVLKSYQFE